MEEKQKQKHRISDSLPVAYLCAFLFVLLGQIVGVFLEFIPALSKGDVGITALLYLEFIGIWLVTLLGIWIFRRNRPILKAIGTQEKGNNWKMLLFGFAVGFLLNAICILVAWLHKDIYLIYKAFEPLPLLYIFVAVFIQSSAEELVCRGFLYQKLRKRYARPAVAIIGNSAFFGLLHLLNEGVTALSVFNIIVFGILFSLVVYYTGSLWCAMAVHAAWNFTQNIIFGLPNSGIVLPYSIFQLDGESARNSFAYNTGFGIEGTILANVVLVLACVAVYLWGKKYSRTVPL